jgi:hypothetical protein
MGAQPRALTGDLLLLYLTIRLLILDKDFFSLHFRQTINVK